MALETRIPKEITEYREKIVFGMSGRQLIAITAAIAVVGLTAFVLWYLLGINFAIVEYILILEALPIVAFGFVRHKGMSFEELLRIRRNYHFGEKHLVSKTSLDFLPSLYPLSPKSDSSSEGAKSEATRKEKRLLKKQPEYLPKAPAPQRCRPRHAPKGTRATGTGKTPRKRNAPSVKPS